MEYALVDATILFSIERYLTPEGFLYIEGKREILDDKEINSKQKSVSK